MNRRIFPIAALVTGLIATAANGTSQTSAAATADNASSFVGDWTLSAQGPQGPAEFVLVLKVDAGKVVGSVSVGGQAAQTVTDISLKGKTLVLKYNTDYQGSPIDTVLSLVPNEEGVGLEIAFAGGSYVMTGSAEKKK